MKYDPDLHHRCSIRLKGYDYAQAGAYFVTICAWQRECLFGEIPDGEMVENGLADIVRFTWFDLVNHLEHIALGEFVIMPNHIHGIIAIDRTQTADTVKPHGLSEMIRQLKTFSAKRINVARNSPGVPVWQRNYYEHVIRDEADYNRIAEYIETNPHRWAEDTLHPANKPADD
jgi:REP element-mobilizing transposase RayT